MSGKWISLLCSLCLCVSPGLPCRSQEHAPGNYFADNGYRDAVELIYHPSGHHHQGTTFLAFEGTDRAPHVCSYNHKTRTWVGPVKAGDNLLFATNDGHGRPSIVVDNRGYIHLAYGGHGGHRGLGINPLGTNGHGEQTHVVSMKPMDVTAWRKVENISPFGTYSQFVKSDEGHLYLFFRHGTHKSDWVYQCSTDAGETFGPPVIVLMHRTDRDDPTIHQKWYAFFNKGTKNTVHCCFVLHPCREKPGHNTDRRNVYYMKMSFDQPGLWKNASGDARQAPIEKETADTHALVFDSGDADCRDSSVRADDQDRPHIVFHKSGGGRTHGLVYTRWTDSEWQAHSFTARSCHDHFADLTVNSADNVQVISAATRADGKRAMIQSQSDDSGATWHDKELISGPHGWHLSSRVTNAHPDAQFIFLESLPSGGATSRLYLWGESGFVPRAR